MTAIDAVFSQPIVQRLGWALLHFVWQGAAVALLLAGAMVLLRGRSANARYVVACFALLLVAAAPAVTMLLVPVPSASPSAGRDGGAPPAGAMPTPPAATAATGPWAEVRGSALEIHVDAGLAERLRAGAQRAALGLERHLALVVSVWLIGVLGLSLRHLAGWHQVRRMRRELVSPVAHRCRDALTTLSRRLGIRRNVGIWTSSLAAVPTAIGWLRPMILLPASALTGLTLQQLESILAHELAHIRRYDYLVNLIQVVIETLLFYHPAVWWVSHRIRIEREYCCDDLAVSACENKLTYARALAGLEQLRAAPTHLAVAATGGSLLARIRRLVGLQATHSNRSSRWVAGACPIAILLAIGITVQILAPAPSSASAPKQSGNRTRTYDVTVPDQWKSLVSAGGLSLVGAPFYSVTNRSGLFPVVRLNWSLKNLTGDPLYVQVYYQTRAKQKGIGKTGGAIYYKLGGGEERMIDIIVPIASVQSPISFLLYMAKPHRDQPTRWGEERQVALTIDPLPLSKPELPTGDLQLTHGPSEHLAVTNVQLKHSEKRGNFLLVRVRNKTTKKRPLGIQVAVNDPRNPERPGSRRSRDRGSFSKSVTPVPAKSEIDIPVAFTIPVRGADFTPLLVFRSFEPPGDCREGDPLWYDAELVSWGPVNLRQAADRGRPVVSPAFVPVEERAKLTAERRTRRFIFRYRPGSFAEQELSKIIKQREEAYDRLRTVLTMDLPRSVRIDLYPDIQAKALGSRTGSTPANTVSNNHIAEVSNQSIKLDPNHELAHIFSYHFGGGGGGPDGRGEGFIEGFAAYFERRGAHDPIANTRKQLAEGRLASLSQILAASGHGDAHIALIDFLLKKDLEQFKSFYKRVTHRPTDVVVERAAKAVYGKSLEALEKEWHAALAPKSAPMSGPQARQGAETAPSTASPIEVGNLKVAGIRFEPIGQGRNVVHLKVRNVTNKDQTFAIHIQTKSPDYGRGMGWGQPILRSVRASQTLSTRFVFKIQGPVTERTWVRLRFYSPESPDQYDYDKALAQTRYASHDLPRRGARQAPLKPVPELQQRAVLQAFRELQGFLRSSDYERAWKRFTSDYQAAEFYRFEKFKEAMSGRTLVAAFRWEKDRFLELQPKAVGMTDGVVKLTATRKEDTWTITLAKEDGHWKVDWIGGYTPRLVLWANWKKDLLPALEKRSTEHFDIHYFKDSTAERDIDRIAKTREEGHRQICNFLGSESDVRICLAFFEDEQTKLRHTGHQGAGWATGSTIVEVYNDKVQLDPYHETTHVLMRGTGNPPALFNEGFAVYMSERLGAPPLKNLSGGRSSLYARVRALRGRGQWIGLSELLTYTDIGPAKSRPPVSYAEAGAFVKFLVEWRGKQRFLRAYKTLSNSSDKTVQKRNADRLAGIYGQSVQALEKRWVAAFSREGTQR